MGELESYLSEGSKVMRYHVDYQPKVGKVFGKACIRYHHLQLTFVCR